MHWLATGPILAQQAAGGYSQIIFLLLIVVVFYVMLIRPQQRKAKQHQALVQSVSAGDRIVTIGGIHGTVQSMDDETIRLEVAPGTVITMARAAIARSLVDADTVSPTPAGTDSTTSETPDAP